MPVFSMVTVSIYGLISPSLLSSSRMERYVVWWGGRERGRGVGEGEREGGGGGGEGGREGGEGERERERGREEEGERKH